MQVATADDKGIISSSEIRPVALPGKAHQQHAGKGTRSYVPSLNLANSQDWRERLFLTFSWPSLMSLYDYLPISFSLCLSLRLRLPHTPPPPPRRPLLLALLQVSLMHQACKQALCRLAWLTSANAMHQAPV